jgi:hypothetical protein
MTEVLDAEARHVLGRMRANGGGATWPDLRAWGVGRAVVLRMLRRGCIVRSARGAYRLPDPASVDVWQQRRSRHLMISASMCGAARVLGLRTAALGLGLPVASMPREPEFIRPPHSRTVVGARVVRRALAPDDVTEINGLPITTVERTAVDVALDLPTPQALVTVDAALRRGGDRQLMIETLSRMGRVSGVDRARTTLAWGDPHSESALESRGRGELMMRGAPRPMCNVTFRIGSVEFRSDLWWGRLHVSGEADGALKYDLRRSGERVLWMEKRRQEWFEDVVGVPVLRFIDEEVRWTPSSLYDRFLRKVDRRGASPWVPPRELEIFQRPLPGRDPDVGW